MALQVWLPFTDGTLKQQGLKSEAASFGGTVTLTNAGKLGKCATLGTAAGGITLPASTMTSFTECSVAFWINIISWNTSYATFFQAGLSSTPWNNYIFGILRNNANSNLCFTLTNSSASSSQAAYTTSNLNTGQWYHLAFTYTAGTVKTYINGALDKTYSTTYVPNFAGITNISIGRCTNNSGYQTNCSLNDFRIYDHCLSSMEVKELSKGLVLHYPLDRNGWGQENLGIETNQGVTRWSNRRANGTYSLESVEWLGVNAVKMNCEVASTSWKMFTHNGFLTNWDKYVAGGTYTLSYDTSGEVPVTLTGLMDSNALNNVVQSQTLISNIIISNRQHYEYRIVLKDTLTKSNQLFYFANNLTANTSVKIANLKFEEGSVATPWSPAPTDILYTTMGLNGTTEYDCSGYCYNGTRTGTFTWTSDTPKYNVSQYFEDGSTSYISSSVFMPIDQITTSVWVKGDGSTIGANSYHIPLCIGSGHAEFSIDSSKLYRQGYYINGTRYCDTISGAIVNDGNWHMMTATYDGTTLCRYLDGQLINSKSISGTLNGGVDTLLIGKYYSGGYNHRKIKQSDVRIYATALSASDVLSLYQNNAYIDTDNIIHGAIH